MNENKQKLHDMIDSITSEGTAAYLETFIRRFLEKWEWSPEKCEAMQQQLGA